MDIRFIKLQSCGKDFILLDGISNAVSDEESLPELARNITAEHFGVGGTAFILLLRGKRHPARLRVFSQQGKERKPDPDALRCAGRYLYDNGQLGGEDNLIESQNETHFVTMVDSKNITVDMGQPFHYQCDLAILDPPEKSLRKNLIIRGKEYSLFPIQLFEEQAVVFAAEYKGNLAGIGRSVISQFHPRMTTLVWIYSREELRVRIWQSGKGEIPSSGACSGAAAVVSVLEGFLDKEALVHNRGGDIYINWDETKNRVYSTGPVEYVFTGTYYWETWEGIL